MRQFSMILAALFVVSLVVIPLTWAGAAGGSGGTGSGAGGGSGTGGSSPGR
jgi:hypothetical protein